MFYTIVFADNLAGLYDYRLRFDTGTEVDLSLLGYWPNCPDFNVTDQEISDYMQLSRLKEVSVP